MKRPSYYDILYVNIVWSGTSRAIWICDSFLWRVLWIHGPYCWLPSWWGEILNISYKLFTLRTNKNTTRTKIDDEITYFQFQLVDLLNLICVTVDSRTKKFNVNKINNVGEFASELMMISGLPHSKGNDSISLTKKMKISIGGVH